jgi:hypothetical protein
MSKKIENFIRDAEVHFNQAIKRPSNKENLALPEKALQVLIPPFIWRNARNPENLRLRVMTYGLEQDWLHFLVSERNYPEPLSTAERLNAFVKSTPNPFNDSRIVLPEGVDPMFAILFNPFEPNFIKPDEFVFLECMFQSHKAKKIVDKTRVSELHLVSTCIHPSLSADNNFLKDMYGPRFQDTTRRWGFNVLTVDAAFTTNTTDIAITSQFLPRQADFRELGFVDFRTLPREKKAVFYGFDNLRGDYLIKYLD